MFTRLFQILSVSFLLLSGLMGCKKEEVSADDDALQSNGADIAAYAKSTGLSGTTTSSGVYYAVTKASSSTVSPTNGQEVEFNYTLYILSRSASNGAVTATFVDSTYATKSSFIYLVATNPGLTEAVLRMHEGDQATILLPAVYAFGKTGTSNGVIPPNAPVRLDLKLKRVRSEDQQINEYMTANKLTPTEMTVSGLRYIKTLDNPSGVKPTTGQTLTVKYRGQLLRATSAFDSTGTGTYSTIIGQSVPGFDEGLAKLKTGEKAIIIFPSKLGYGATGVSTIPPYAPLRFDIELVSAR